MSSGTEPSVLESGVLRGGLHPLPQQQEVQVLLTHTLQPQGGTLPKLVCWDSVLLLHLPGPHGPHSHLQCHLQSASLPGVLGLGLQWLCYTVPGGTGLGETAAVSQGGQDLGSEFRHGTKTPLKNQGRGGRRTDTTLGFKEQ